MATLKIQDIKINSRSTPRLTGDEREELRAKITRLQTFKSLAELTPDEQAWVKECNRKGISVRKEANKLYNEAFPEETRIPLKGKGIYNSTSKSPLVVNRLGEEGENLSFEEAVNGMALSNRDKMLRNPIKRFQSRNYLDKNDIPTNVYMLPQKRGLQSVKIKGRVDNAPLSPVAMSDYERKSYLYEQKHKNFGEECANFATIKKSK